MKRQILSQRMSFLKLRCSEKKYMKMKDHNAIHSFPKRDPTGEKQKQGQNSDTSFPETLLDLYII